MTEKLYTEREKVLAERDAVVRTLERTGRVYSSSYANGIACELFPLPKITRPRVSTTDRPYGSVRWRVVDRVLQWRYDGPNGRWQSMGEAHEMYITIERAQVIADLVANPTETVEDPGDAL